MTVDGAPAYKAATQVGPGQALAIATPPRRYVSRGGHKLAHALDTFGVEVTGRHVLDAGVSTGGFTDCLLQHGAAGVAAFDVGYGQVHERIRTDPRVRVRERTNVRHLTSDDIHGPPPSLVVADLSFISLTRVLAVLRQVAAADAEAVLLVKPQFESERGAVGRGGVVRDPGAWAAALHRVIDAARAVHWWPAGVTASPLLGPAGNVEFLLHLVADPTDGASTPDAAVEVAVGEGRALGSGARGGTGGANGAGPDPATARGRRQVRA